MVYRHHPVTGGGSMKEGEQYIIICAYCHKRLNKVQEWELVEDILPEQRKNPVSHGICPNCLFEKFPGQYFEIQEKRREKIKSKTQKGFTELYGFVAK